MSFEASLQTIIEKKLGSDKYLTQNMNTNHSLALSQTLREMDCQKDEDKKMYYQVNQTIIGANKQISYLPQYSQIKGLKNRISESTTNTTHRNVQQFINSLKMIAFLDHQNFERAKFIRKKQQSVKRLQNKISSIQEMIKYNKEKYHSKQNEYKNRLLRVKIIKKSMNKRLATQILDLKGKMHLIKAQSVNSSTSNRPQIKQRQIFSRRNSERACTEPSRQKIIYLPLPYGFQTNKKYTQAYQKATTHLQQQQYFQKTQGTEYRPKQILKRAKNDSRNNHILQILGEHIQVPQTANTIQSLTCSNSRHHIYQSIADSNKNKRESIYQTLLAFQSKDKSISSESIEITKNPQKSYHKQEKQIEKFVTSDFKLGNLVDSVQSEYTLTQKQFKQKFKQKAAKKSQSSRSYSISSSQNQDEIQGQDNIIESIKLTSHSKFYKERLSQSKYIPHSQDPSNYVENSELLGMNLLANSNISIARNKGSNSKVIKKKIEAMKTDKNLFKSKK